MKKTLFLPFVFFALLIVGCSDKNPQYVNNGILTDTNGLTSMGIDSSDFEKAASDATQSLLRSGALDKSDGGKYVVAIGRVINDTTQRIDTDLLIKKIRIALLNSKKAIITTAVGAKGAEDRLTEEVRALRENDEFKQSTIAKKDTIHAPNFSLSGKIIQKSAFLNGKKQIVDYYFLLTLTDLETGLATWENESKISKVGSNKSVIW